jgi:hypothetical protein
VAFAPMRIASITPEMAFCPLYADYALKGCASARPGAAEAAPITSARGALSVRAPACILRAAWMVEEEVEVSAMGRRILLLAAVFVAGCASHGADLPEVDPMRGASRAPGRPWQPAAADVATTPRGAPPPGLPSSLAEQPDRLSLAQLVDAALRENPSTRAAWQTARAAAATYGAARGAYYPSIVATGGGAY